MAQGTCNINGLSDDTVREKIIKVNESKEIRNKKSNLKSAKY